MNHPLTKLVYKGLLLLLPFFLYYVCYDQYLIYKRDFKNDSVTVYNAIDKSKRKVKKKKIIFGDSVGAQLYPNYKDEGKDFYSLTTSAPSSLVGIYILLENFLANNSTDSVEFIYVVHPSSLDENLKGKYTYNHFVKPFYTLGNLKYFTPLVNDTIHCIPYWYAAQFPFIKISDWQPEFNFKKENEYNTRISPVYIEYLKKIDLLAKEYHFKIHTLMPILRENNRGVNYDDIKKTIHDNGLDEMFSRYFTDVKYLPIDQFHEGSNHYLHPSGLGDNPLGI